MKYKAIVSKVKIHQFWCKVCKKPSDVMYYGEDESKYCEHCVTDEVMKNTEYFNQMGEKINYKGRG